jgi:hypothetical protein
MNGVAFARVPRAFLLKTAQILSFQIISTAPSFWGFKANNTNTIAQGNHRPFRVLHVLFEGTSSALREYAQTSYVVFCARVGTLGSLMRSCVGVLLMA